MKRCTKCGQDKPRGDFYADARRSDGCQSQCKACVLASQKRYREANPDKVREGRRQYYADPANRERIRERNQQYYEEHREQHREQQRAWREANPDRKAAADKAWRDANRERKAAKDRAWAEAHPDRAAANKHRYYEAHRDEMQQAGHEYLAAGQAETREQARRNGYMWTGPELELISRPGLTAKQCALMLGRTLGAVYRMRGLLRDDPRKIALAGLDDPAAAETRPGMTFGPLPELAAA